MTENIPWLPPAWVAALPKRARRQAYRRPFVTRWTHGWVIVGTDGAALHAQRASAFLRIDPDVVVYTVNEDGTLDVPERAPLLGELLSKVFEFEDCTVDADSLIWALATLFHSRDAQQDDSEIGARANVAARAKLHAWIELSPRDGHNCLALTRFATWAADNFEDQPVEYVRARCGHNDVHIQTEAKLVNLGMFYDAAREFFGAGRLSLSFTTSGIGIRSVDSFDRVAIVMPEELESVRE